MQSDLTIAGHPDVFVVGDLAAVTQGAGLVPAVAPAAVQAGRHAAENVLRALSSQSLEPFRYVDRGSLATIGRSAAVADLGRLQIAGPIAWIAWLVLHVAFLVGFRNRAIVVFQWAWSFISFDRGARLITGPLHRKDHAAGHIPASDTPTAELVKVTVASAGSR